MGPKTIEFEFSPFWIYSVCGISNTSLVGSTYWQVFYPIVSKINTIVDHDLRSFNFENGAHRTKKVQFRKWCGSNAGLHYPQNPQNFFVRSDWSPKSGTYVDHELRNIYNNF